MERPIDREKRNDTLKQGTKKLIAFAAIVVIFFILNRHYGWSDFFTGDDWYGRLQEMVETNFLEAAFIYIVFTVVACVVLAVPGVTFAIIAGAVFGPYKGTVLCVLAATIGAIVSFIVGRFFLQDSLRDKIAANKYINKLLFNEKTKDEMLVLMITRLVPVFPYNLQNFAYGVTDMSLARYSLGTFIFMIPGTAMYTFGTYAVTNSADRMLYIGITVVIAVAVIIVSRKLRKKYVDDGGKEDSDERE